VIDFDLEKPVEKAPVDLPPRSRPPLWPIGAVVGVLLGLIGAYIYLRAPADQPVADAKPAAKTTAKNAEPGEQIPLPPLDETDALVRQLVGQLSSNPTVAAWLATDGLILNFAVVTQRIADGENPVQELRAIGPIPPFRPVDSRGDLSVDPTSYRRYDRYAAAVSSLDARGTASLYATLKPRVVDAYRRQGETTGDFDPVLERAIVELLEVPVVQGRVGLVPSGIVYAYEDPKLEGLTTAQKYLLRTGPQNVQTIQAKLREIADYLGIPASRLPKPSTVP
jgi:hypothetical protein